MSVTIFIADVPEFLPLVKAARETGGCHVRDPRLGYWRIEAHPFIQFGRKELGLIPALWNSALSGGFIGRIVQYDRLVLRIESEDES